MHALDQQKETVWVLVADAKQAHVYHPHMAANGSPESQDLAAHGVHKPTHELVPVFDLHINHVGEHAHVDDEKRHNFTREIATKLNTAFSSKKFNRLVLAAPAKMIGELRALLTPDAQHHIAAVLPKDLTHYQGRQLLDHLQDTLAEAHLL